MDGTTYDPFHGPRADKIIKSSKLVVVGGGLYRHDMVCSGLAEHRTGTRLQLWRTSEKRVAVV